MGKKRRNKKNSSKKSKAKFINQPQNILYTTIDHFEWLHSIKDKLKAVYHTRRFRILTIAALGMLLMIAGILFSFVDYFKNAPLWSKMGPVITIACDTPGAIARVYTSTDEKGETKFRLQLSNTKEIISRDESPDETIVETRNTADQPEIAGISEKEEQEIHVWVGISSINVPMEWQIDERLNFIENYEPQSDFRGPILAKKTGKMSGSFNKTMFKITYSSENPSAIAEITISESEDHILYRGNGIAKPRLPIIMEWFSVQVADERPGHFQVSEVHDNWHYLGDSNLLKLTINNQTMYSLFIDIYADYASHVITEETDLVSPLIFPEPEKGYPLIQWHKPFALFPTIQFRDMKWETNVKKNSFIGGLLIGYAISIFSLLVESYHNKKEKTEK